MLGRVARFQSYDRRRKDWIDKDCPNVIGETLLAREGVWRVPVLLGIVHTPQLRADGSLLTTPGYDPQTQLLFKPDGELFPEIPEQPQQGRRTAGAGGGQAGDRHVSLHRRGRSLSGALAAADRGMPADARLRAAARDHRTGARDRQVAVDRSGLDPAVGPAGAGALRRDRCRGIREAARRLADGGDAVISFDNCTKPLDHALLCQALSQSRLNLRVLGYSQNRDVTMSALLTATGNNLILQGDLPRRSLRCEIDAKVERPELRVFPGAHIQTEFRRRRGELVAALLTILRAYQVSGAISNQPPLGGFEMWSRWVRDALIWLDCSRPLRHDRGDPLGQSRARKA